MKLTNPQAVVVALVIAAVLCSAFLGAYEFFSAIEISTVKGWAMPIQELYRYVRMFFLSGIGAFMLALVRNLLGFFEAQAHAKAKGLKIEYNIDRYWSTIARYLAVVVVAFAVLPAPWNGIATVLAFFIDLIGTELKRIFGKP